MIPVAKPDVGDAELSAIGESLGTGWIGLGPKVEKFEAEFGDQFGYDNVIATNSCTAALDLALKAADPDGSEVLVPPMTWISTAFTPLYNDYDVTWVDVSRETLSMDLASVRDRISDETAAVIPVHYGGRPAEIEEIVDVAHEHDAIVIEDAAHAVGAEYRGEPVGSFGDVGCFSFQATKPLTTGEGGALVTDDDGIAETARRLSKLGVTESTYQRSDDEDYSWDYDVTNVGRKYFMHDIAAAMGLVQLERFPELQRRRIEIAETYYEAFADVPWIEPFEVTGEFTPTPYNYSIRVPAEDRDSLITHLGEYDVGASVHYRPLYMHSVFDDHDPSLPVTQSVWREIVTLPMSSVFSEEEVRTVIDAVTSYTPSS